MGKTPNPKHQTPRKLQATNSKSVATASECGTLGFFGAWGLVFGISEWFAL